MLVGSHFFFLAPFSARFTADIPLAARPAMVLSGVLTFLGAVYLAAVGATRYVPDTPRLLGFAFAVGLLMRLSMMTSAPMLEDDWARYLLDGAVTAAGANPYALAPADVRADAAALPDSLRQAARAGTRVLQEVNHPQLRTIYPPLAQAAFAGAYWLRPWSLTAWRVVLLVADLITMWLLVRLLRQAGIGPMAAVVYWWNPLVVKELFNSAHMDGLVLPLVLGALLLAGRRRYVPASLVLAAAVGVKVWPVLLLPLLLRPLFRTPRRLFVPAALFASASVLLLIPVWTGGLDEASGFVAYSGGWEMNDALFMLILWPIRWTFAAWDLWAFADVTARLAAIALVGVWSAWLLRRPWRTVAELGERCVLLIAGMFLLSPTQFPWYAVWFLPLLALCPRPSLLLLTVLLPLYYLRFHCQAGDNVGIFDYGIVWLEFVPVWCLLFWEWRVASMPRGETV